MGLSNYLPSSRISQSGVCTSTTRPASPYEGQVIYETDTNRVLVWEGSAWVMPNSTTANPPGLELVKTQTIGSAVSSVTVNDAFSADYDHYLLTVSGGSASGNIELRIQLGATTSNYKYQLIYGGYANSALAEGSTTAVRFPYMGLGNSSGLNLFSNIYNPYNATRTHVEAPYFGPGGGDSGRVTGMLDNTTQYTAFTLGTASGTMTGGTIRVYGYRN